jgi:hypothetical protein
VDRNFKRTRRLASKVPGSYLYRYLVPALVRTRVGRAVAAEVEMPHLQLGHKLEGPGRVM